MQKEDLYATWADTSLLNSLTDNIPQTNFKDGINQFINWYFEY
jgi:UDP-glucuronate 4-epimerase